jgi:hypothetical protein
LAEIDQLMEFLIAPVRLPVLMIAILLAAPGIHAGCLQVTILLQADPDIVIGGRQAKRSDPLAMGRVVQQRAVRQLVAKTLAAAMPSNTGFPVPDIDKAKV